MNRILIIGGTGNVGRQVIAQLPSTGVEVRALVRNLQTAALPPHVEVVRGDLTEPETLDQCLDGIDTVFLVWTAPPSAVPPAVGRMVKSAQRIVLLSAPYKTQHPLFQASQPNVLSVMQAEMEALIEASGREFTFLRPGMFATNALTWWAPQIRAGSDTIRWPYATAPTAPIHERDIAAVAVKALCEDGHSGAEYVLTGPLSLTQSEQLAIIGEVIGHSLRMEEISPDQAREELLPYIPAYALKYLLPSWAATVGVPALVTSTVGEITGTPARTLREWAADHAAAFQA